VFCWAEFVDHGTASLFLALVSSAFGGSLSGF